MTAKANLAPAIREACAATFGMPLDTLIGADLYRSGEEGGKVGGYVGTLEALFTEAVTAAASVIEADVRSRVEAEIRASELCIGCPPDGWTTETWEAYQSGLSAAARIVRDGAR